MEIKIKSESGIVPAYETAGSAGMDIRAYLKEPVELLPGQRALIPTGIYLEIPEGYEVQIRARRPSSAGSVLSMALEPSTAITAGK